VRAFALVHRRVQVRERTLAIIQRIIVRLRRALDLLARRASTPRAHDFAPTLVHFMLIRARRRVSRVVQRVHRRDGDGGHRLVARDRLARAASVARDYK
jgi:predicted trehalose synthase